MKTYRIQNRETHEWKTVKSESAQEACAICGWMIGNCYVKVLVEEADGK
jgi:hypothetical protein